MVTVIWGQGLSEDGRETFDSVASVAQARVMLEHDSDLTAEELDQLFETGKAVHDNGSWIVVER